jgi:hypothetical protein
MHDAVEQLAIDHVREVDAAVGPNAGFAWKDLRPPLMAAGAHIEFDLVAG